MTVGTARRVRPGLRAEAFLLAAVVRAGVRCFSVPQVARGLAALPRCRRRGHDGVEECMAAAASGAARGAHSTCLFRSLVAFALLARRRHDAAIHLGANREGGPSFHAWITIACSVVEPQDDSRYVSLWHHRAPIDRRHHRVGVQGGRHPRDVAEAASSD